MKTIRLTYPPSTNRYWRINKQTGKPYKSEEARAYIDAVGWECAARGFTEPTLETVSLRLQFMHDGGRRIDLTNGIKVLEDALQGFVYVDDKQVVHQEAELVILPRKSEPYVLVTVVPCEARILEAE
jgi:Holliday junction resolvase RusA-like endonuclease